LVALIVVIGSIGIALLFPPAAATGTVGGGTIGAFCYRPSPLIVIALVMCAFATVAYPFYGAMLFLLVVVEVMGHIGMARALDQFRVLRVQPSELMKIALVLALGKNISRVVA